MKTSLQEIVRRTRGRGTALGGGNYLDGGDGADTLYADMGGNELFGGGGDVLGNISNGNDASCIVTSGRNKCEAANDAEWRVAA